MKLDPKTSAKLNLLLFSGLALYTESVLIRWIGAEIRMFAYLKNFTLLAAFLGLGIGMLRRRGSRVSWRLPALISLLALTLVFSAQLRLTRLFFPDAGITQWAGSVNSPLLVPLARQIPVIGTALRFFPDRAVPWIIGAAAFLAGMILFLIVVQIFIQMGERIGELLRTVQQPPLRAYTLNLLGSLIGTLLFVMVVWLASPPWVWFLPIFLCLLYFSHHRLRDALILGPHWPPLSSWPTLARSSGRPTIASVCCRNMGTPISSAWTMIFIKMRSTCGPQHSSNSRSSSPRADTTTYLTSWREVANAF